MAPAAKDTKSKTRRSRKARTEVSSSSSSSSPDSESSVSTPEPDNSNTVKAAKKNKQTTISASNPSDSNSDSDIPALPAKTSAKDSEQVFQDFYLKQATKEFSEDLDKLRNAGDWRGQGSLEVLVAALKQGGATIGTEERRRVGGAKGSTD